jgi:hypothetical protein
MTCTAGSRANVIPRSTKICDHRRYHLICHRSGPLPPCQRFRRLIRHHEIIMPVPPSIPDHLTSCSTKQVAFKPERPVDLRRDYTWREGPLGDCRIAEHSLDTREAQIRGRFFNFLARRWSALSAALYRLPSPGLMPSCQHRCICTYVE